MHQRFVYPLVRHLLASQNLTIGSGECAALAQFPLPGNTTAICPHLTQEWRPGEKVRGNLSLPSGTLIAIFHHNRYANKPGGIAHTALYLGQSNEGIEVVHQFKGKPIKGALIRFGGTKLPDYKSGVSRRNQESHAVTPEDDANNYYTVTIAPRY